ncbi:bifunctional 2-polyprenyl-6-hydroxyphenol methylase/3-demethylubiquinol 3-O-methyltransferase UbiG [Sulfitobacter sp. S190]|uniref:class I SAM-dependent methyltransferase n=1 Tax=Sulfitobacter sp. S190 TaxID=2867022 RepID=UPI0021A487B7|nr:class I SAM-dependent methyltransferase [Sulfitobacter sp. S190]UWR22892.1 class I SAM-dependent methyltransferase [Sulfitobacter sp. S190]
MSDDETLRVYAAKTDEYARIMGHADDPLLDAFIAALPQGGTVLDLGCGPGGFAAAMARAGLRVTATDAVPEMVAMAAQHPGVDARVATFDQIEGTDLYDGIWANFSLLHAGRDALPVHLAAIARALRPGGLLHIAMKTGTGTRRDAIGRRYTYVTQDELHRLLTDAGLSVKTVTTGRDKGLDGTYADWIALGAYG